MAYKGSTFFLRQFADDERVKVFLRNLHTKTFSRNRKGTRHGRTSKIQRRDRSGRKQLNTYTCLIITKMVKMINEHPTATFTWSIGT